MPTPDTTEKSICSPLKKRQFSIAAQALVSGMLNGKVDIHCDDIQLEIEGEKGGAIYISERISENRYFLKMWAETTCIKDLKILAQKALRDKL